MHFALKVHFGEIYSRNVAPTIKICDMKRNVSKLHDNYVLSETQHNMDPGFPGDLVFMPRVVTVIVD